MTLIEQGRRQLTENGLKVKNLNPNSCLMRNLPNNLTGLPHTGLSNSSNSCRAVERKSCRVESNVVVGSAGNWSLSRFEVQNKELISSAGLQ